MNKLWVVTALSVSIGLAACDTVPPRPLTPPPASPAVAQIASVAAYPAQGQSLQQADRDRYECHNWAVRQSGFDPSQPSVPPAYRVQVARPQGSDIAGGGLVGALIGASVTRPRDAGVGALIGAVTGAAIGAASDQARNDQADRAQAQLDAGVRQHNQAIEAQAQGYRRAITACLETRGYSVR
jgi:Glycine zipper